MENSQIQNLNWNSEFPSFSWCLEASISKSFDTKVVDLYVLYKFAFGQISSAVQISSSKSIWKSPNLKS